MGELIGKVALFPDMISVCLIKIGTSAQERRKIKFKHKEEEFEQDL